MSCVTVDFSGERYRLATLFAQKLLALLLRPANESCVFGNLRALLGVDLFDLAPTYLSHQFARAERFEEF